MAPMHFPASAPELSVVEEGLYRHLTDHVTSESDIINAYREMSEAPGTPEAARYLIRLILEDEERHHRLFYEITTALGNGIAWAHHPDAVPDLPFSKPIPALEHLTEQFLNAEHEDEKKLRELRKELRPFKDTSLWSLLVELMEHDTAKHIKMLTFLRDNIARGRKI